MPKQPKRTQPKVDLREDELKEIKVNIRTSVYECIIQYIGFHEGTMGPPKPSESKVVDRGMEAFFESDEAFQTYLKKRAKSDKAVQPAGVGEGGKVGAPRQLRPSSSGSGTSL